MSGTGKKEPGNSEVKNAPPNGTPVKPRIVSVGTANPPDSYTQEDLISLFKVSDPRIVDFFRNSHIKRRRLVLPEPDEEGGPRFENGTELLEKHRRTSIEVGSAAIRQCLDSAGAAPEEIDVFIVVTSTGFLCPGLASILAPVNGFRNNVHRVDIVGMGCNGGMNGLETAAGFAGAAPGTKVLLLACEICSAAYVFDLTLRTGVVNSLFGDGAAAVLIEAGDEPAQPRGPRILDFESILVHEAAREMRFDFEDGLFSFYLGRDIPYLVGANVEPPVDALLARSGLKKRDVNHWIVHSGGKKVIDSIMYNLGLTARDMRFTTAVLENFGNLSSASIFFSYRMLLDEGAAGEGDTAVVIAMGPGVSIETGLLKW